MKDAPLASRQDSLVCPLCEVGKLRSSDRISMRCESCGERLSGPMLEALRSIFNLPDALGSHACEDCGHPEMRRLPDEVFHCPACGSEVLPIGAPAALSEPNERSEAYWAGWMHGRFGERSNFADNPYLARWEAPSDRLDYYKGHRAGSEAQRRRAFAPRRLAKGSRLFR